MGESTDFGRRGEVFDATRPCALEDGVADKALSRERRKSARNGRRRRPFDG